MEKESSRRKIVSLSGFRVGLKMGFEDMRQFQLSQMGLPVGKGTPKGA